MRRVLIAFTVCCTASMVLSGYYGPYKMDADTLHLWHFDAEDTGVISDAVGVNPIDLVLDGGGPPTITDSSYSSFRTALNTFGEPDNVAGAIGNPLSVSNFTGTDGSFTFEAIIKPAIEFDAIASVNHQEIICGDSNVSRGWQFRINKTGVLRFHKLTGTWQAVDAPIPTEGIHAYKKDCWYHVAVTYNGGAADPNLLDDPNNLKLYWTKLDSGVTKANLIGKAMLNANLDTSATVNFSIGNELRALYGYTENFQGLIDEVRISRVARTPDEMIVGTSAATNPSPPDGAANVDPATQISWNISKDPNATGQYLYWVEDIPVFDGVTPTHLSLENDPTTVSKTMDMDRVYFWRVDTSIDKSSAMDPNTIVGDIWTFSTLKTIPVITLHPLNLAVFEEETAVFTTEFVSVSEPSISWYRASNPDTNLEDVTLTYLGNGLFRTQLQIAAAQLADQDIYYCSIRNGGTGEMPVRSQQAQLYIKRLLVHLPFEGNAQDAAINVDGIVFGNPTYIASSCAALGQAIMLNGEDQYVLLGPNTFPKAGWGNGLEQGTVTCWVRIDKPSGDMRIVGIDEGQQYDLWVDTNDGMIRFVIKDSTASKQVDVSGTHPDKNWRGDGKWHFIAATYEKGVGGQMWLDGQPYGTNASYLSTSFNPWTYGIAIGAGLNKSGSPYQYFGGAIDDVRLYNYSLSQNEIESLFFNGGGFFCINPYANQYDLDNNCKVDLCDIAEFAKQWLDCGRWPQTCCD